MSAKNKRSKVKAATQTCSVVLNDSMNMAKKYLKDFSRYALSYSDSRSDEALALVNRTTSLLTTTILPHHINPSSLETAKFFTELHSLVSSLAVDQTNEVFWSLIGLLQHFCQNEKVKIALVEGYRFVPLLTSTLTRTLTHKEKTTRLLTLLQDLTYGIKITWEEPFVVVLLEQCVHILYGAVEQDDEELSTLALSILINICYKNYHVLLLFMRTINLSEFNRKIQGCGTLAIKMLIVLSEDLYSPDEKNLHRFIRSSFATIRDCLKAGSIACLKHTIDFLLNSKGHGGLHRAMLNYPNYCEDIERILELSEESFSADHSNDEIRSQQEMCLDLLFQLIFYILQLSNDHAEENKENIISLDSNIPRIFNFICNRLDSDVCGTNAIRLMHGLVEFTKGEKIAARISEDPSILAHIISITENPETDLKHAASVLRLLLSLFKLSRTEKLILSKISDSYFDKIFQPVLAVSEDNLACPNILSLPEIERCIFGVLLLLNFASVAKKAYFEKCCSTLESQQIQYVLACGTISGNESTICAIFQISQFEHFPQVKVAKFVSQLRGRLADSHASSHGPAIGAQQKRDISEMLRTQNMLTNKSIEERLNALIGKISSTYKLNQLNELPLAQIVELYDYKIQKNQCMLTNLENRLEDASKEITLLKHYHTLQNLELEKYHQQNMELRMKLERYETQCTDLKKQRDDLKRNSTDLMKKVSQQSESLQISEKRLSVKISELIVLQKEHDSLTGENEKLVAAAKENTSRIEKLKKNIAALELETNKKGHILEERERELTEMSKALEAQKQAKKKSDDIINALESQLQEKNEAIRNYEREIDDTEELRKTILSLMESKKPKRKA